MITDNVSIQIQRAAWNKWNAEAREHELHEISLEQRAVVLGWLDRIGRTDLKIIEVGCGAGWLTPDLQKYGTVVATDLSDEVLDRARTRNPGVTFIAGDFMSLEFDDDFDVVVCLETISSIACSQIVFVDKLSRLLRPKGYLMLSAPNKPVLVAHNLPPLSGQVRQWVDRHDLNYLIGTRFVVAELFSITPHWHYGWLRMINSRRAYRLAGRLYLGWALRIVKRTQEVLFMGWTLMALGIRE